MTSPSEPISSGAQPLPCYRHPHQMTYIRCSRCGKPICNTCMHPAPVGYQCRQCVRAPSSSISRSQRWIHKFSRYSLHELPIITYGFIAINIVVFLLESKINPNQLSLWPFGVAAGQYYRLITSAFLHYGILHLVFNMWALYVVGPPLETYLGKLWFSVLYGLCGLGGSVTAYLLTPLDTAVAGASGIIFGLFGATFIVTQRLKLDTRGIITVIIVNLGFTFTIPNISWQGHLGGLITGLIIMAFYVYTPQHYQRLAKIAVSLSALAILMGLIWWRTAELSALFSLT